MVVIKLFPKHSFQTFIGINYKLTFGLNGRRWPYQQRCRAAAGRHPDASALNIETKNEHVPIHRIINSLGRFPSLQREKGKVFHRFCTIHLCRFVRRGCGGPRKGSLSLPVERIRTQQAWLLPDTCADGNYHKKRVPTMLAAQNSVVKLSSSLCPFLPFDTLRRLKRSS